MYRPIIEQNLTGFDVRFLTETLEQCRLTRTIGAQQGGDLASCDGEVNVSQYRLVIYANRQMFNLNHVLVT